MKNAAIFMCGLALGMVIAYGILLLSIAITYGPTFNMGTL